MRQYVPTVRLIVSECERVNLPPGRKILILSLTRTRLAMERIGIARWIIYPKCRRIGVNVTNSPKSGLAGRFSCCSRLRTGADFASRPEIRKMLWHFHGFNARSLPLGINPPLHASNVPYGNLLPDATCSITGERGGKFVLPLSFAHGGGFCLAPRNPENALAFSRI